MLRLATERTAAAHPYLVTPEHTHRARAILGTGALLAPEQHAVLDADATRARELARNALGRYLNRSNYTTNWQLRWRDENGRKRMKYIGKLPE